MANNTYYMYYQIYFPDQVEYQFALDVCGGPGSVFLGSPRAAATLFGITVPYPSVSALVAAGNWRDVPKSLIFDNTFTPGRTVNSSVSNSFIVDDTVDSITVPSKPGVPAIWPTPPDTDYVWSGSLVHLDFSAPLPATPTTVPQRRWATGFEILPSGEGGTNAANQGSRDSSRTLDGIGWPIRGQNNTAVMKRFVDEYNAVFTTRKSWERFYLRVRVVGTTNCGVWRCHGSASALAGASLKVTSTGLLQAVNINAVNTEVVLGTAVISLNTWHKIDVLLTYSPDGILAGALLVYIDGILSMNYVVPGGAGLGENNNHSNSDLGKWTAGVDNQVEIDLDDWICADFPTNSGATQLDSIDWILGSHVRKQNTDSGGASLGVWAGPLLATNQGSNPEQRLGSNLTSNTANDLLALQTDVIPLIPDFVGLSIGPVAATVGMEGTNSGNTDGTLGYLTVATIVDTVVDQLNAPNFNSVMFRPTGLVLPARIDPFHVRHRKSNDANLDTMRMLMATVEYIGVWGIEDQSDFLDLPRISQIHNGRFTSSPWTTIGPIPFVPCFAKAATYVGNGTTQVITTLEAPIHFLWIRALTGGARGVKWFATGINGHFGTTDRVVPNYPTLVTWDIINNVSQVIVTGDDAEINAVGVTYQFVLFSDPGMIYNLCGAYNHPSLLASSVNPLQNEEFVPTAGFVQNEILNSTSNIEGLSYKGPGHTGNDGNQLSGTSIASWGTFGLGVLNTLSGIHYNTAAQVAYSLWRTTNDCGGVMVQLLSYVGNGAGGTRTINLTPVSGRFPMFAMVVPHNAVAYMRDPSHTGSNSCTVNTLANSTTAIVGSPAIDRLNVGVTLNANGIIYDVFVICGSDAAAFLNSLYFPPLYCAPDTDPWIPPHYDPPDIAVLGDGGLVLDGTVPLSLLADISGIYTLTPGATHDTFLERAPGITEVDIAIPDPGAKTGYIGG